MCENFRDNIRSYWNLPTSFSFPRVFFLLPAFTDTNASKFPFYAPDKLCFDTRKLCGNMLQLGFPSCRAIMHESVPKLTIHTRSFFSLSLSLVLASLQWLQRQQLKLLCVQVYCTLLQPRSDLQQKCAQQTNANLLIVSNEKTFWRHLANPSRSN